MSIGVLTGVEHKKAIDLYRDDVLVFSKKNNWLIHDVKAFFENNMKKSPITYAHIHDAQSYVIKDKAVIDFDFQPEYFSCKALGVVPRVPMNLVRTKSNHYVVTKADLGERAFNRILDAIKLDNLITFNRKMRRYE